MAPAAIRPSEVRYAKSGRVHVAFQTYGEGPVDLVVGFSGISQLDVLWEEPGLAEHLHRLASFTRLILFDKRGLGLSDRNVGIATLDDRMDDIRAVLDAIGSKRTVLFGTLDGAPLSLLFAATYPQRTQGLILWGGQARMVWAPDYPWAKTAERWEADIARDEEEWGSSSHIARMVAQLAPSRTGDAEFARWLSRRIRFGASPAEGSALARMNMQIDVRWALSALHVPTLVMYTPHSKASTVEDAQYLARHIPGAVLREIDCPDHLFWTTPRSIDAVVGTIQQFVRGLTAAAEPDRVLTTVLFTDLVGSTQRAAELGDGQWGELLSRHLEGLRTEVMRYRGTLVKTTGDGALAIFDGPTRAIHCALALQHLADRDGLSMRAGLHTGECLLQAGDVQGIAVHIASRISDHAGPGEVLVSNTVRELSIGSDVGFVARGAQPLRGIEGEWRLFAALESLPVGARAGA